jgi:hypothetical protein
MFFSLKVKNSIPRNRDRQRWTKIAVEGKIFAFGFSKKFDLSLLSIECQVLDRCRAFDRLVSVDAHLCIAGGGGVEPKKRGILCLNFFFAVPAYDNTFLTFAQHTVTNA